MMSGRRPKKAADIGHDRLLSEFYDGAMRQAICLVLILLPGLLVGCETDLGQPLPIPTRVVCLDFSGTSFPADWQQTIYGKMFADFAAYGYRITFHDLDQCDYRIDFVGDDDAGRWGVAYVNDRRAQVFTASIERDADSIPIDAFLQGVSNAAAHELGHLLGYDHVTDLTDVMSVPDSASVRFFDDQQFYP